MIFKWEKDYGGMAWTVGVTLGEPGESDRSWKPVWMWRVKAEPL